MRPPSLIPPSLPSHPSHAQLDMRVMVMTIIGSSAALMMLTDAKRVTYRHRHYPHPYRVFVTVLQQVFLFRCSLPTKRR